MITNLATTSAMSETAGEALNYVIVDTNMRIDLESPLKPGQTTSIQT